MALGLASASLASCTAQLSETTDPTTTTSVPLSGVIVPPDSLLGSVRCGLGGGDVYRYFVYGAAVSSTKPVTFAGVFDCYAQGRFVNLELPSDVAEVSFRIDVAAFSKDAYDTENAGGAIDSAARSGSPLVDARATWESVCAATTVYGLAAVASCTPLAQPAR